MHDIHKWRAFVRSPLDNATKGFATYDVLPGLYIGLKAGLTILDLSGNPLTTRLDIDNIFATFRRDARHPQRTPFVAAREPALAKQIIRLLKK